MPIRRQFVYGREEADFVSWHPTNSQITAQLRLHLHGPTAVPGNPLTAGKLELFEPAR
jgi:hypothetical protein